MEKRTAHYPLSTVKRLVAERKVRSTYSALAGAAALGLGFEEMLSAVTALTAGDMYKSMTTHADHRVWQDVYRPTVNGVEVYLKLTVLDDVLIVSFKEASG